MTIKAEARLKTKRIPRAEANGPNNRPGKQFLRKGLRGGRLNRNLKAIFAGIAGARYVEIDAIPRKARGRHEWHCQDTSGLGGGKVLAQNLGGHRPLQREQ